MDITSTQQIVLLRSSTTRAVILRHLERRPANLAELTRWLGINKSAVHKHLQILVAESLVHRVPSGRWVYYRLSPRGGRALHGSPVDP